MPKTVHNEMLKVFRHTEITLFTAKTSPIKANGFQDASNES